MQPSLELLAQIAYEGFLQSLGDHLPPFAKPWAETPAVVQHAWKMAVQAVLEKISDC